MAVCIGLKASGRLGGGAWGLAGRKDRGTPGQRSGAAIRTGLAVGLLLAGVLGGGGCQKPLEKAIGAYSTGRFPQATEAIDQYAKKKADTGSRIYAFIEQGAILRAAGDVEGSNAAFDHANQAIAAIDNKAEVSVSAEATAVVTNLRALPYRGTAYDRIMVSVYRALNYLALGDIDAARPELIRAYQRQEDAVRDNRKQIEKAQDEAADAKKDNASVNVERTQDDPQFQSKLDRQYAGLSKYNAYAVYVNPMAEYLQGLYFLHAGGDNADHERARTSLKRVVGMTPGNQAVADDLALCERVVRGGSIPELTYVLFETGMAPKRDSVRIDLPVFLVSNDVPYVGANFPKLVMQDAYVPLATARAGGRAGNQAYPTQLVADFDQIVATEFRQELPIIITKTIIAAATKAAIAYGISEATKGDSTANLIAQIATTAYQVGMNQADLRTWRSLPKQTQVARLPTPADRQLAVKVGSRSLPVSLIDGRVNVVYVKSIAPGVPPQITQFKLR